MTPTAQASATATRKKSTTQIRLYANLVLLVSFILANIPQATGIPIHEWVGLLFVFPLLVHLVLDWNWIVNVSKRLFKKLPGEVRFNHFWDLVIFIMMILVLLSGILVSESALPSLGINIAIDPFWQSFHDMTANLTMIFIGVHLAMHWSWLVSSFKRYVLNKKRVQA